VVAAVDHLAEPAGRGGTGPGAPPDRRARIVAARAAATAHERALGVALVDGLRSIDGVELLPGWDAARRTATATFLVRGSAPAQVAAALDRAGINVWHGNGYARSAARALGLLDTGGAVRASLNHYNRAEDVDRLLRALTAHAGAPDRDR
jgi:selenocysteine lyase/cysteine desulfurase